MHNHILATLPQRQVQRRTRQRPTKSTNMMNWPARTSFTKVAMQSRSTWNHWAVELVQEIGKRATLITGEPRESTFLFQQLSITLQGGNAVAFLNTSHSRCLVQYFFYITWNIKALDRWRSFYSYVLTAICGLYAYSCIILIYAYPIGRRPPIFFEFFGGA